jgi:hypothetical protein
LCLWFGMSRSSFTMGKMITSWIQQEFRIISMRSPGLVSILGKHPKSRYGGSIFKLQDGQRPLATSGLCWSTELGIRSQLTNPNAASTCSVASSMMIKTGANDAFDS